MAKITLDSVASGYDLSKINSNFVTIAAALNDEVLYRDNPVGEVNTLLTEVDANSQSIYNIPTPTLAHEVANKAYVDDTVGDAPGYAAAAAASAAAALVSENNALTAETNAELAETNAEAAQAAAEAAAATIPTYPSLAGNALEYIRVAASETAVEYRTAANVLSDIGAAASSHNHTGVYEPADATILKDADIGVAIQAYDVDTTKNDVANSFTAIQKWAKGADVASANALNVGADGNYFDVTGTTAITSIATEGVGVWIKLHFDDILTLTHHSTDLILPGAANITTAAGDEAEFVEYATGDWRCTCYTRASGTAVVASSGGITLGTPVASTSGTSIDFTSIPAGTKRITIMLDGVSTNGTSYPIVQIGDSGGVETSSYTGTCAYIANATAIATAQFSAGFIFQNGGSAAYVHCGQIVLTLMNSSTNTWSCDGNIGLSSHAIVFSLGGTKSLSAVLDRVRITTMSGADTFDAGSINIAYE